MPEPAARSASHAGGNTGMLLIADDFAMTNGVSRAILELAEARRISGTSAMTTTAHWPAHATWLARARGHTLAGLHLNLTLGAPLGRMPRLAPGGRLPVIGALTQRALRGGIPREEVAAEFDRQIAAFELEMGFAPDHIDGHQHVHALPGVRRALFDVLARRYPASGRRPLLRDPADAWPRIVQRGRGIAKSAILAGLSSGFGRAARAAGFPVNNGFSGVTDFNDGAVAADFAAAARAAGPRALVMCHPGFVDEELKRLDPVTERRQAEYDFLLRGGFPAQVWVPARTPAGDPADWRTAWAGTHAARDGDASEAGERA